MASNKRATLPGADTFFQGTTLSKPAPTEPAEPTPIRKEQDQAPPKRPEPSDSTPQPAKTPPVSPKRIIDKTTKLHVPKKGSGRQRHDEKVTFYCTREELFALERARLALRELGASADRGRIVREALSYTLADLEANGAASILADRLTRDDA